MPRDKTNYIDNPIWGHCPKKAEARNETIVRMWRDHFKTDAISPDKQYWTMCGGYFDKDGQPQKGELFQLQEAGLITLDQFYGVDQSDVVIAKNKKLYPKIRWLHGDFLLQMKQAAIAKTFNPAIINYDGVHGKKIGAHELKSILVFLDNNVKGELMLIANFALKLPYPRAPKSTGPEVIGYLLEQVYAKKPHWKVHDEFFNYHGTGKRSKTTMGTFIFYKS